MRTRRIGSLEVSVVGLGCNNFGMRIGPEETRAVVDAAIDVGINYFDTAEMYGGGGRSEELLGQALGGRRSGVYIATKWGATPPGVERPGSRDAVMTAVEGSLARLGTDYIDHYQLHRPDPATPIEETLGALAELVDAGKVREIGCSNFDAAQLDQAAAAATLGVTGFASVQNQYSLLTRDPETDGVLDACRRHSIAFVPYFPLESGVLTGKYRAGEPLPEGTRLAASGDRAARFIDDHRLAIVAAVSDWAAESGHTVLDAAMSWLAGNAAVATVIAGATRPEQVTANAAAATWEMTPEQRAELERVLQG